MTHEEKALEMASRLIEKSENPLTLDEALAKVFEGNPGLYAAYRAETLARKPKEETVATRPTISKTVGQLAVEGIAKQLVARSAAGDMEEGVAEAFRLRPDLYELYRRQGFANLR
jgi:hypothetical protein